MIFPVSSLLFITFLQFYRTIISWTPEHISQYLYILSGRFHPVLINIMRKCWMSFVIFLPIWFPTFDLELFVVYNSWYLKVRPVQMLTTLQPIYSMCFLHNRTAVSIPFKPFLIAALHSFSVFTLLQQPHFYVIKDLFCVKELQQSAGGVQDTETRQSTTL